MSIRRDRAISTTADIRRLPKPHLARRFMIACLTVLAMAAGGHPTLAQSGKVTVFAAASLKNALDTIAARWQAASGDKVTISYAASSTLAKQIENGAPAGLFISADLDWMDYLDQRKLIDPATRYNLLGNKLVLIAPNDSKVET